jgi:drug/metabolite transporter (DMT)-like permease
VGALTWVLNTSVALLAAINAVAWGHAIREVGDPQLSLSFLLRLIFNKWFILAMVVAFIAAILSYAILREMGVLAGRFFLSLQIAATVLVATLILGERLTPREWIGVLLIIVGAILVGRW